MKVVVAPDSFKGSISAVEAARAIAEGIRRVQSTAVIDEAPLADGGEGLVEALVTASGGSFAESTVEDPLGRPVKARYGFLRDGTTAVIEMAAASGLPLLAPAEREPMKTTTFGTGQLMLEALQRGARKMIIGIGGSATVDGGMGMARALGVRFLDDNGEELAGGGELLPRISRIDFSGRSALLEACEITVACDVSNPLLGPEGAALVYGPQKGATPEEAAFLDRGLANLSRCIKRDLGMEVAALPGGGAAGGLGAGLFAFLGAALSPGIGIVLEAVGIDDRLREADLVFTGEGRVDRQSTFGKVAAGVAAAASRRGVPVILLAGSLGEGAAGLYSHGVTAVFSIAQGPATEGEMIEGAAPLVADAAEAAYRVFLAGAMRKAQ